MQSPENPRDEAAALPHFSTLLRNLNGMVYRCRNDADWSMMFISEGCRDLLGFEPASLLAGQPAYGSLIHPDDGAAVWQAVQDGLAARRSFQIEYRIRHADGGWRWAREQGAGLFDPAGNLLFLEGFVTDITARKAAEQGWREMAADLDATLRALPDLLFELDENGRYLQVWANQPELLAEQRDRLLGRTVGEVLPPQAAATVMAALREAAASGHTQGQQIALPLPLGERWFEISTARKTSLTDGRTRFIMLSRDITERKAAELALRDLAVELEARVAERTQDLVDFKAALDQHAIVATTDAHGTITYINDKFCAISKYAREELIGQNHHIINSGYHSREFFTGLWQTIASGVVWKGEIRNRAKDGTIYWVDTTIVPFLDEYLKPVQYIAIHTDITARKQAEQELLAAKDAAERANRAKDSFLATMSHEIRTPLGGLLGMLELLALSPLSPEQDETLQTARDSGRSLLRILNDILDWSKIEEGKLELAPQTTSIDQLVAEVANTYSHVASTNSVTLTTQVDARLSPAHLVDALRLSQVLNNFVSNAIKFSHGGHVELRAALIEQHAGVETLRLEVTDTGIGIAPEVQQRLFQNYGQANANTARMYGGTGLGLAICRRLADLLDGRIEMESAPGHGSTFSITLTLPIAQTAPSGTAERVVAASVKHFVSGDAAADAPMILVVDDNPINRKLLARQLELFGLHAETAENGQAALALWRAGHYALVITDCHMPAMDGYALARTIRENEAAAARPRTPIFAWTANALPDEVENCRTAGMDELLVKPAELALLAAMLAKWLPGTAAADSTDAVAVPPAPTFSSGITPASQALAFSETAFGASGTPNNSPAPTLASLDVSVLAALVGDDPATLREFLRDFRASATTIAAELAAAGAAGDAARAGALAHKLKSAARAVGALALGEICAVMEAAGKAGQGAALAEPMLRFASEMAAVDAALADLTTLGTQGKKKNDG
ncbi:MAG: PAS domain S-box protein [Rhodocyclaceae bacterium]|nr:PAS domain S-box protein [Rhodocyclaceae bacterium]